MTDLINPSNTPPFVYYCPYCENMQKSYLIPKNIIICDCCGKVDIKLYSVDLRQVKPEFCIKIIKQELLRRDADLPKEYPYFLWTNRKGETIRIDKLPSNHLRHIIEYIKKSI